MKKDIFLKTTNIFQYDDYKKYRIAYIASKDSKLIFVFILTIKDNLNIIKKELENLREEFLNLFSEIIDQRFEAESLKIFDPIADSFQNKFPPHVSLVGYTGVGKTTIFNLLRSKELPIQHDIKIGGDTGILKIGKCHFLLRDFTGQEEIGFLWNNFVKNSDVVFIISDSSPTNVERSKFFLKLIEEETPYAYAAVLGNKNDVKESLNRDQIEEILGLKVHPLIAIKDETRENLIKFLLETLEMYKEMAPLFKLLQDKEFLLKQFENALIQVNIEEARFIYEKLLNICLELGENPLNMDFYRRYEEIQQKLNKVERLQETLIPKEIIKESQLTPQRIGTLEGRLKTLLSNYINSVEGIIGVIISDLEGFVITSESKKDPGDESILGAIAVTIDTYIEKIKKEFGNETSFFNITTIQNKKFAYCSVGSNSILLSISDLSTSDTELRVYSEHIAKKVEHLLEGDVNISLEIPEIIKSLSKTKDGKIPPGDFSFKLILTGDFAVGKTSLIRRFVQNLFVEDYHSTVGVDISQKIIKLSENTKIKFIIWDIGGQMPKMATYGKKFYEGARFAFIVIDRTKQDGLNSVDIWYDEIKKSVETDIKIILIGNKSDLSDKILVSESDIKKISEKYNFHYIITSAKTGENVNEAFLYISYRFLESI